MWTIPGLLGLVLMLLASAEASSSLQQYFTSDTALRPEVNDTEQLLAVNRCINVASKNFSNIFFGIFYRMLKTEPDLRRI